MTYKRLVVALVSAALVVLPLRRAQAVFPVPIIAGIVLTFDSGAMAAGYATAIAAAAAGAALLSVAFKDSGGADALVVRVNPKAPMRVPAGWSAASPASDAPVPPSTATPTPVYNGTYSSANAAAVAACQAWSPALCSGGYSSLTSVTDWGAVATSAGCSDGNPCAIAERTAPNGGPVPISNITVSNACPKGYTYSAPNCNLSNASVVVKPSDNIADFGSAGSTVAADALDPDTANLPGNVTISGDSKSLTVTDANGTKRTVLTNQADGSLSLEQWTARGDGTSDYTRLNYAAPNGSAANGGRVATGGTVDRVVGEGAAVTGTGTSGTGTVNCEGCATEATQLANKAILQDLQTNGIKQNEQASSWSTPKAAADAAITAATAAISQHESKLTTIAGGGNSTGLGVTGLGNYSAPGSAEGSSLPGLLPASASCQALVLSGSGLFSSFNVDICPVVNGTRAVLEWGLYLLTMIYAYFAFLRPRENF